MKTLIHLIARMKNLHQLTPEDDIDPLVKATNDELPYKVKSLANVYAQSRMMNIEPFAYIKANKSLKQVKAMDAKIEMIEKSDTIRITIQNLVHRLQ